MSLPTLEEYRRLMSERPRKFSADEVNYRRSGGEEKCCHCISFYERRADDLGTCEIFRSSETDRDGVRPYYVCDFYSTEGEDFPLYPNKSG